MVCQAHEDGSRPGPVGAADKRAALPVCAGSAHGLRDAAGLLVLVAHGGYAYQVVDGADLAAADPAVWLDGLVPWE